ncbi:MAG: ferrochelatase, partial [Planctomycetes bacterium]|nr:ferrochelatase [Planctomycetota bacterium]
KNRTSGVLLVQLGSPGSFETSAVRKYLFQFLTDERVIDNPPPFWKLLLRLVILPVRAAKVSKYYKAIERGGTLPLLHFTKSFSDELNRNLSDSKQDYIVKHAYIIGEPSIASALHEFHQQGVSNIRVIYQFPQYCEATTLSAQDALEKGVLESGLKDEFDIEVIETFHKNPAYIKAFAALIDDAVAAKPVERLVMSFHGYPLRRIFGGDPYFEQCRETAELLMAEIKNIPSDQVVVSFQSRFGSEEWLWPSTEDTLIELAEQGIEKIAVVCPGFTVDNLETLHEVGIELEEVYREKGGKEFNAIPCLNEGNDWVQSFKEELILKDKQEIVEMPIPETPQLNIQEPKYRKEPLSDQSKATIKTMFIVLMLDLIGFSIIFPLLPGMIDYYAVNDSSGLFPQLMNAIAQFRESLGGVRGAYDQVIFGGVLGAIYSLLQFVCSPIVGTLSDRFGRKPILQVSLIGIACSYLLWIFADSFVLLFLARVLGGIMSGNISTATAVVSDVTSSENRSKGMAFIGIAFGLGFILGPAIGALSAMIKLNELIPSLQALGINPFSMPAVVAFGLTLFNFSYLRKNFKESLSNVRKAPMNRFSLLSPFTLFNVSNYPGVFRNNMIYFLFLLAFSGMEFTLTFLTRERFNYTHLEQGLMFLFIGITLAMVQGGYVRRKASDIGEVKMASQGFVLLIPAFVLIGFATSAFPLYLGLFLMAIGSAQIIPCLTSLVSQYAPEEEQGRVVGVFRALGALARMKGPLLACLIYWTIGADLFYYLGAIFVILPLILMRGLPSPKK